MLRSVVLLFSFFIVTSAYSNDLSWKKYPYHQKGTDIHFPKDEGKHSMVPNLEWWYSVIHARGETTNERYSILVSHFNNHFRFFTVTNLDRESHISGTAIGRLRSKKGHLDLTQKTKYGIDFFRNKKDTNGNLIPFEYEIKTHHQKMKLEMSLNAIKKPLMVGGTGYTPVGKSGHTWYYSLTRLEAIGRLTVNGFTENIVGEAWMDHQWGPFVVSPVTVGKVFESYEWFCVQLEDGTDLMISNIYDRQNRLPLTRGYGGVDLVNSKGESKTTLEREFVRTGYWQDPVSGSFMSMGWKLNVPKWNLKLDLKPDFLDQMVRFPLNGDFWEGSISVSGTINGKKVKGKAFGELIHRFKKPEIKISKMKLDQLKKNIKLKWKIKNTDEGNPLLFDIEVMGENGTFSVIRDLPAMEYKLPLGQVSQLMTKKKLKIKITAHSIDRVITNNEIIEQELEI